MFNLLHGTERCTISSPVRNLRPHKTRKLTGRKAVKNKKNNRKGIENLKFIFPSLHRVTNDNEKF